MTWRALPGLRLAILADWLGMALLGFRADRRTVYNRRIDQILTWH